MSDERVKLIVEKWVKEAEKVVEPKQKDLMAVAKLYIAMKDLLRRRTPTQ